MYVSTAQAISSFKWLNTCTSMSTSARNNSRPLAILQPVSAFGRPKFNGTVIMQYPIKIPYLQKTADQFLIPISSTGQPHPPL